MKSLLFVQHGDYAEAFDRFAAGGGETHRDQRETVEYVQALAPGARVTTFAFAGNEHRRELAPNLVSMATTKADLTRREAANLIAETGADHVILRSPMLPFVQAANDHNLHLLPMFADTFRRGGPRTRLRNIRLAWALRRSRAPCIANHATNASRSMVEVLGLPADIVVPWEHNPLPMTGPPKRAPDPGQPLRIFFAGLLTDEKGLGDLLEAVAALQSKEVAAELIVAGRGDLAAWETRAQALGIEKKTRFLGLIPMEEVQAQMRGNDVVVVPTRHDYPEGFPNTISEGVASGSPIVISDHPAFVGRIPANACLTFRAGKHGELAQVLQRLSSDANLYEQLSAAAEHTLQALTVGMNWRTLLDTYLNDPENRGHWVQANSLRRLMEPQQKGEVT